MRRLALLALLCAACTREAAPGVREGAEIRVDGVSSLRADRWYRVNDVSGDRARVGDVWVDFERVESYEVRPK